MSNTPCHPHIEIGIWHDIAQAKLFEAFQKGIVDIINDSHGAGYAYRYKQVLVCQ